MRFNSFLRFTKDVLFPIFCFACGKEGEWLCRLCIQNVHTDGVWACPLCHADTIGGVPCASCSQKSAIARHCAIAPYREDDPVGRLIRAYKYDYAEEAFLVFGQMIDRFVAARRDMFSSYSAITPVPLHPRRFAERGFNQAEAIAQRLSSLLSMPVIPCLRRIRYTKQQATLSKKDRRDNVKGAFAVRALSSGLPERVLLVDDVFTTGSTMQECARILIHAGARDVAGFTIARG